MSNFKIINYLPDKIKVVIAKNGEFSERYGFRNVKYWMASAKLNMYWITMKTPSIIIDAKCNNIKRASNGPL